MFGGFPFAFGGMGGMGGMGGPGPDSDKEVDTTHLYEVLGVEKTASDKEIRRAYMDLAKKEHPDKGGDAEKFKTISKAYEVLSDPEKRKIYDDHGEEGVERGGGGGDASDIFEHMFGGGGGGGGRRGGGRKKAEDIQHAIGVSLDDLYAGKTVKLRVNREKLCGGCSGTGSKSGAAAVQKCAACDGRGFRIVIHRMGPMIQQMQAACDKCNGEGRCVKNEDLCESCNGSRTKPEQKMMEVHIEKGMKSGDRIVLRGEADEAPGMEPGDVVFTVQEKPHEVFKRQGCDLVMKKEITLQEAICGTRFVVDHFGGKQIVVVIPPGEMISPDDVRSVVGKGMPIRGNPFVVGDLFIKFEVAFPKKGQLTPEQLTALAQLLPGPTDAMPAVDEDVESHTVTELDVEAARERSRLMRAEDSDDEGGRGGPQRVQCAQQ